MEGHVGAVVVKGSPEPKVRLLTVGHSNRSLEEFLSLLKAVGVRAVADVRRYPSSRKFPHFNQDALRQRLDAEGIRYAWFEDLGGRRHGGTDANSPNAGLESPGFRNYADHMLTDGFHAAAEHLLSLAAEAPTAILCAEKFYWKCHRRLLSDYLVAQGAEVEHILERGRLRAHALTQGAVVRKDANVVYPPTMPALKKDRR